MGRLLRAIDGYKGLAIVGYALKLAPLVFVRPGELRGAEWVEFDLDGAEWRMPPERMKMGEKHIVPLARQAVAILRDLHRITGFTKLLFPSVRAVMYSVISSAKRHDLDPWRYLRDVFARLPDMNVSQLPELLPDCWRDSHQ